MPSKRQLPLEDPPSASSSEESEEVEAEGDEDETEEEEEEEEEQVQTASVKPSAKNSSSNSKPNSTPTPAAQPRSNSDSDEESDTVSGSDSEPSPEKPKSSGPSRGADSAIKPIASKPMSDNAKTKKSSSSNATAAATAAASAPVKPASSSKRSLEVDKSEKESKQKKKKKSGDAQEEDNHVEETEKKQGGEDSKKLFQRIWSDEDEIVILKGMLNYIKKGLNPSSNLSAFLDSIKNSLHVDVSQGQFNSKVQRMKQRYMNQASRAKNGQDPHFSKPHDLKAYQLSKKIWGGKEGKEEGVEANNGGRDSVATDGKKNKSGKTGNGIVLSQPKAPAVPESHHEVAEAEDEEHLLSLVQYGKTLAVPPPVLGDFVAKEGLGLIGSSKVKEFDERWRKILAAETKIYLQRLDLAREYTKSILNGLEPSNS